MRRRPAVLVTVVSCLLTAAPAVAPATASAPALTARFTRESVWSTGYGGRFALTNTGDAETTGWVVEFDLPPGSTVGNAWNAVLTRDGRRHRFANAAFNGRVAPGGTAGFGFNVTGLGTPTGCTVDGAPCDDVPEPDTSPPTAPTGPRATAVTAGSVSLAWTASTDDVGVTDYQVLSGGAVVATTGVASAVVGGLLPATAHTFTVRARDVAGNTSPASAAVTATTAPAGAAVDVSTAAQLRAALAA
ncbi:cellulose binding domain-containing protein, partial [Saccharothrix sp. MB29]|nr:cellulose binding domain-containing protein [Saccharothrix sp. MB29]